MSSSLETDEAIKSWYFDKSSGTLQWIVNGEVFMAQLSKNGAFLELVGEVTPNAQSTFTFLIYWLKVLGKEAGPGGSLAKHFGGF